MVACRIAFVTNCQLSKVAVQATGRLWLIHMYPVWSLAWSLIVELGILLEKSSWGSQMRLHQATEQAPGRLLYFKTGQGGRLSRCRRIILYMYFSLWILVSRCF